MVCVCVCAPVILSDEKCCREKGRGRECVFVSVPEMTWPVVAEDPSQGNLPEGEGKEGGREGGREEGREGWTYIGAQT